MMMKSRMRSSSALRLVVVARGERLAIAAEREHLDQARDADLDQVDAGRFERLDEAAGEAQRDAVPVPGLAAPPGRVSGSAAARTAARPRDSRAARARLVLGHGARCNTPGRCRRGAAAGCAIASRRVRAIARVYGRHAAGGLGLHGQRAVGRQPVAPILVAGLERLFDQQAAKAGAIDEQVAFDARAVFQHQRSDEAALAVLLDAGDLAFDAPDTLAARIWPRRKRRVEAGIEMIGVVDRRDVRACANLPASAAWCSKQ